MTLSFEEEERVDAALQRAAHVLQLAVGTFYRRPVWDLDGPMMNLECAIAGARTGQPAALRALLGLPPRGARIGEAEPWPPPETDRRRPTMASAKAELARRMGQRRRR